MLYLKGDAVADSCGDHGHAGAIEGVFDSRLVLHPLLLVALTVVVLLGVGANLGGVSAADDVCHGGVVAGSADVDG